MRSPFLILFPLLFILSTEARENPFVPVETYGGKPLVTPLPVPDFQPKPKPDPIQVINKAKCIAKPVTPTETTEQNKTSVWKELKKSSTRPKPILFVEKKVKKRSKPQKKIVHHKKKRPRIHKHHKSTRWYPIYKDQNLQIMQKGNLLKIKNHDPIIADFMISNPPRLVLDFGNDFVYYETLHQKISKSSHLKSLKIGTHDCFYRVTFVLKHPIRYRFKKFKGGYLITLYR